MAMDVQLTRMQIVAAKLISMSKQILRNEPVVAGGGLLLHF